MRFICEVSRDGAESVADQFTKSGDKTHNYGACTEGAKKRSDNTSCSFVSRVCEEVNDPDNQDKSEGRFGDIPFFHLVPDAGGRFRLESLARCDVDPL